MAPDILENISRQLNQILAADLPEATKKKVIGREGDRNSHILHLTTEVKMYYF